MEDEYQQLVLTKELENTDLKEKLDDINNRLADAISENLEFKAKDAEENLVHVMLEKQVRELSNSNASLSERIESKKEKIKNLKEELAGHGPQCKGVEDQLEILVAGNW